MIYSHDDLVESLPDDETEIKKAQATLEFIGEAWVNDQAVEVDNSRVEFMVPLTDLHREYTDYIGHWGDDSNDWAIHSTGRRHFVSDCFKRHENAPQWVNEWDGPFTIKIKTWGI